jgi:hypothetical protein
MGGWFLFNPQTSPAGEKYVQTNPTAYQRKTAFVGGGAVPRTRNVYSAKLSVVRGNEKPKLERGKVRSGR